MSIMYKPIEPLEVGIGESMPAEFIKEAERSRARTVSLTDEVKRLQTENTKLRELCEYLWEFAKTCGADHPFLRELGIEVDR